MNNDKKYEVWIECWWKRDDGLEWCATFKYREPAVAWAEKWYGSNEGERKENRLRWVVREVPS